jgi:hypothetical protein
VVGSPAAVRREAALRGPDRRVPAPVLDVGAIAVRGRNVLLPAAGVAHVCPPPPPPTPAAAKLQRCHPRWLGAARKGGEQRERDYGARIIRASHLLVIKRVPLPTRRSVATHARAVYVGLVSLSSWSCSVFGSSVQEDLVLGDSYDIRGFFLNSINIDTHIYIRSLTL